MSASLVGSEMCIRDRFCEGRPDDSRSNRYSCPRGLRRGSGRPHYVLWPVSYTHLTLPTICSV
eukprot:8540442-Alexandrium_andersonii.AAC.1